MIVWLNGAHGVGKTTAAAGLQRMIPGSHVLDAEKVGEVLMDVRPPMPDRGNFQHWEPWRPLVVETARRVHDWTGGVLIMPMTVLVEAYWTEIAAGLAAHDVPVLHLLLHADEATLRARIDADAVLGPSSFRAAHVEPYLRAHAGWLGTAATVVDTSPLAPGQVVDHLLAACEQSPLTVRRLGAARIRTDPGPADVGRAPNGVPPDPS